MEAILKHKTETDRESLSLHQKIHEISKYFEPYTISLRHKLHEIPELGWEEEKTLQLIQKELEISISESERKFEVTKASGGIWVDYEVDPSLPWVLFRADIDALPIQEETNLPFQSKHPGKMHACGHDCHTAMLLAAFKAFTKDLIRPFANIRFVWQRAEEFSMQKSGGRLLVDEGVCENIDHVYGLHIAATLSPGKFYSRPGTMMANTDQIKFSIECSGGHVMRPDLGSNAIYIMNDILNSLRGYEGIFFSPQEPIAFVPSISQSGVAANVRPNQADMCFALRNFQSPQRVKDFVCSVEERVRSITSTYNTARITSFEHIEGYPMLQNDPDSVRHVQTALNMANIDTEEAELMFSGEDFTYFLQEKPGSFWCFGARQGQAWDHHTAKFNPDERYLHLGVSFWMILSQYIPSN